MAHQTGSYTTSDLSRKSGDIIAEALRHPVTITQRNKPRLIQTTFYHQLEVQHRSRRCQI